MGLCTLLKDHEGNHTAKASDLLPRLTAEECVAAGGHCLTQVAFQGATPRESPPEGILVAGGSYYMDACRHCGTRRTRRISTRVSEVGEECWDAEPVLPGGEGPGWD